MDWLEELSSQLEQATPRDWYYFNRALGPVIEFCRAYQLQISIDASEVKKKGSILPYINSFTPTLMSTEQRQNILNYVPSIHLTFYVKGVPAAMQFHKVLRFSHYAEYVSNTRELGITVCSNQLIFSAAGVTNTLETDKSIIIISMLKKLLDSLVVEN